MKLLGGLNLVLLAFVVIGMIRGFDVSWGLSILPLAVVALGAVCGFVPTRICMGVSSVCGIAGGLALMAGGAISVLGGLFMLMGASREQIDSAEMDATLLFIPGLLALVGGGLAMRQLIKRSVQSRS